MATPPRNLRQFRLGWLPLSNWFRKKYGPEAQITVISIDKNGSMVHGGLNPYTKPSSPSPPHLTAMSPDGEVFAVASLDGKIEIRRAADAEVCKSMQCMHASVSSPSTQKAHNVMWMYFLDQSSLVAEYGCGEMHKCDLGLMSQDDSNIVHTLQSPSDVFSTCSLDRSTILRLARHSDNPDVDFAKGWGADGHSSESLSVHILHCKSWETPLDLSPLDIPKEFALDPRSLSISHNNQYAGVVLAKEGSQHDACRRVCFWSIKERRFGGFRDVQCPKWESWAPASYFHNYGEDHSPSLRRYGDATQPVEPDFIADVYHPDTHLRQFIRPRQQPPTDDCLFFVVHGGQTHTLTSPITFTYSIDPVELQFAEFAYPADMSHFETLPLCIRDIICGFHGTSQDIPLDIIGRLHHYSVTLTHLAKHVPRLAHDVARQADLVARAACEVACAAAALNASHDGSTAAHDAALAGARIAGIAARIADSAADVSDYSDVRFAASSANSFADHADYFADAFSTPTSRSSRASAAIQCSGTFRGNFTFQLPHHLVLPLLLSPSAHLSHQCGGSRIVVGGHAHPYQGDTWVPVSMLEFRTTRHTESRARPPHASSHNGSRGNGHPEVDMGVNATTQPIERYLSKSNAPPHAHYTHRLNFIIG